MVEDHGTSSLTPAMILSKVLGLRTCSTFLVIRKMHQNHNELSVTQVRMAVIKMKKDTDGRWRQRNPWELGSLQAWSMQKNQQERNPGSNTIEAREVH